MNAMIALAIILLTSFSGLAKVINSVNNSPAQNPYESEKYILYQELSKQEIANDKEKYCHLLFKFINLCFIMGDIDELNDYFEQYCSTCDKHNFSFFAFSGDAKYFRNPKLLGQYAIDWRATEIIYRKDEQLIDYLYLNMQNKIELERLLKVVNANNNQNTTQLFRAGDSNWCDLQLYLGNYKEITKHCSKSSMRHAQFLVLLVDMHNNTLNQEAIVRRAKSLIPENELPMSNLLDMEYLHRFAGDTCAENMYRSMNLKREKWFRKEKIQREIYESLVNNRNIETVPILGGDEK